MFLDYPSSGSSSAACCFHNCDYIAVADQHFNAFLPYTIVFDSISADGRQFGLKSQLAVPVKREEGLVVLESKQLPIIAYGDSLQQASAEFQEHFAYLWDSIAQQPDDVLAPDAIDVKRLQLNLVSEIAASA